VDGRPLLEYLTRPLEWFLVLCSSAIEACIDVDLFITGGDHISLKTVHISEYNVFCCS
jgi:hypothetical protein